MHDSDSSGLSSYASGTSSDDFEIDLNASNDARSNTPRDSTMQKLPARQKSNDEPTVQFASIKIESQIVEGDALTIKISPDKLAFAVGLSNAFQVFFIDKQMNENNVVALKAPGEKLPCNDLCFIDFSSKPYLKKNPNLLAVYSSGYIRLWDCFNQVSQASMIFEIFESATPCDFNQISEEGTVANELLCVALSMDATRFVTGGNDTVIKVYDLTTRLRLLNLKSGSRTYLTKECTHHTSRISALVYHPRGKNDALYSHIFVSASWDQTIQIWDDRKVASLWFVRLPNSHVAGITTVHKLWDRME
ncbi:Nucleoporin GLE2 [Taenia solium]